MQKPCIVSLYFIEFSGTRISLVEKPDRMFVNFGYIINIKTAKLQVSQQAFLMLKKRKYNILYPQHMHRETENFKIVLQVMAARTMSTFLIFFMIFAVLLYSSMSNSQSLCFNCEKDHDQMYNYNKLHDVLEN